ncbi:hypothetical protein [Cellulomonas iranensis]
MANVTVTYTTPSSWRWGRVGSRRRRTPGTISGTNSSSEYAASG